MRKKKPKRATLRLLGVPPMSPMYSEYMHQANFRAPSDGNISFPSVSFHFLVSSIHFMSFDGLKSPHTSYKPKSPSPHPTSRRSWICPWFLLGTSWHLDITWLAINWLNQLLQFPHHHLWKKPLNRNLARQLKVKKFLKTRWSFQSVIKTKNKEKRNEDHSRVSHIYIYTCSYADSWPKLGLVSHTAFYSLFCTPSCRSIFGGTWIHQHQTGENPLEFELFCATVRKLDLLYFLMLKDFSIFRKQGRRKFAGPSEGKVMSPMHSSEVWV